MHNAPYRDTVDQLADALQLEGRDRSALEIASQRPRASEAREGLDQDSAGSDATLLLSKLMVPTGRPDLAVRPRLMDRLQLSRQCKLTVIAAPAGFGKTTLLAQGHSTTIAGHVPVAWVSLDSADNDPGRFWRYTIMAIDRIRPGTATSALSRLQSPETPPIEAVLTVLLHALSGLSSDTILVLDDYHLIEERAIHEGVSFLLDHLPSRLHVIISTRDDPPLPLARFRMRRDLLELRAADLRFTTNETAILLNEVMALKLSEEEMRTLETRTEGWIAGLQLAVLAMRDRDDVGTFISAFAGSHRYVADYLMEEVLLRQPETVQLFLLQCSVVDRMCGSVCDALMGWETGSQALLEQLERANVFVIPLDEERHWHRFHHLFSDMLHHRLRQSQPDLVNELHGRASIWFEQHGQMSEAITHALRASDIDRAAGIVERSGLPIMLRGQVQTVLAWLKALPDEVVRSRPSLSLTYAVGLMFAGAMDTAEARLKDAERCIGADMADEYAGTVLGTAALVRANMAQFSGDMPGFVTLSQRALDLLPDTVTGRRSVAVGGAACRFLVTGDLANGCDEAVGEAVGMVRTSGDLMAVVTSLTHLARLRVLQGRLRQAAAVYGEAWDLAEEAGGFQALIGGAGYHFGLGDLLRERNDLDGAEQQLKLGIELTEGTLRTNADFVTSGYMAWARLLQERGEYSTALDALDEFAQIADERGYVGPLLAHAAAERARIALVQGDLGVAMRWAEENGLSVDDELSFPREIEHLTLVRVLIAHGRCASAQESRLHPLRNALHLLDRLLHDAEAKERMGSVIEMLVLRALTLHALGDTTEAVNAIERAVSLARPEGYVRVFVDEGAPMASLLSEWLHDHASAGSHDSLQLYGQRLLLVFQEACTTRQEAAADSWIEGAVDPLLDPLTDRELAVLRLVAASMSNREIGAELYISLNTVKWYVKSVYSKLSVQNRTGAVARARALHLVPA